MTKEKLMDKTIKIKKGLDIPIGGKADINRTVELKASLFGIVPDDYPGYTWKASVKEGDTVDVGTPLLHAKENELICLVSPVSGTVREIHRGERRKIEFISVERSGDDRQIPLDYKKGEDVSLELLMKTGLFSLFRQRPFDIVARAEVTPRDIFITAFDTSPLAPEILDDNWLSYLEDGLSVISRFTAGKVYLSVRKGSGLTSKIAEVYEFEGPHPAGNVGTQIAAIKPVNKGETVWTADALTVCRIGKLYKEGILDFSAVVALTGDELKDPHYVRTSTGVSISQLLEGQIKDPATKVRIISGNVLTGVKVDYKEGFLRFPYRQVSVIEEGDGADEFMGWASMDPGKFSVKKTFPGILSGLSRPFKFDARIKGGHRAMILSGEYDKVFPMDILPEYLIKAIMAKDIEKMEKLGIYEVAPEDFALPEFVDTSKIELQKIVREGLDYLRKETT